MTDSLPRWSARYMSPHRPLDELVRDHQADGPIP
jgi:hypothetical protein